MFALDEDYDQLDNYVSSRQEMEQCVFSSTIGLQQDRFRYQIEDIINKYVDDRISLLKEFSIKQDPLFYPNIDIEIGKIFHRFMGNYFDRGNRK